MPIYRVFGNSYNDHEIWVRAQDQDEALKIADDAPEEAWSYTGEGYEIHAHDVVQPTGPDENHEDILYKPEETVIPEGEDKLNWIDLTELAAKKYPHLEDDCE